MDRFFRFREVGLVKSAICVPQDDELNLFRLLKKFEDGIVDLPSFVVEYLHVQYGEVDNILFVPNERGPAYSLDFRVIHVTTKLLGSGDFKVAVDHRGFLFISCYNPDDISKLKDKCRTFMYNRVAFRRIREIVPLRIDPGDVGTTFNEDNYIEAFDNVRKCRRAAASSSDGGSQ